MEANTEEFTTQAVLYFIMEMIEGSLLGDFIRKRGPASLETSVQIVRSLLKTIRIAYDEDVIHRDLKPNNVMLHANDPSDVVLLDFGLSFRREDVGVTDTGEHIGNRFLGLPERMAPGSDRRDIRSDLTAVAGLLFYLVTGDQPVVLVDEQNKPPHRRSDKTRTIGESKSRIASLERFFDRAFGVMIEARFQDIAEIESGVDAILNPALLLPNVSPATFATSMCNELSQRDRASQLLHFKPKGQLVQKRIFESVSASQNKLSQVTLGCTQNLPSSALPGGEPAIGSRVTDGDFLFWVKHAAHNYQSGVSLQFGLAALIAY